MDAASDPNWSRRIGVGIGLVVLLTLSVRGGTLAGALLAIACLGGAWYLVRSRRRALRRANAFDAKSTGDP